MSRPLEQIEMDRLRLTVEKSELEKEQAQHEHDIAGQTVLVKQSERALAAEQVRRRRILAPLEGVVVQVNRRRGEWVEPGDQVASSHAGHPAPHLLVDLLGCVLITPFRDVDEPERVNNAVMPQQKFKVPSQFGSLHGLEQFHVH